MEPNKKLFFKFVTPIPKNLFLRTDTLESERLAVEDGRFVVYGVATIHAMVLVFVRGFNMQVCLDQAAFHVNGCV